jgi:hypothetical protein
MLLRAGFGLAVSLLLTACEGGLPDLRDIARPVGSTATSEIGQTEIRVTDRQVALRAPSGFCIDPVSTRNDAGQAFVVFGNCAAITGNPDQPQPFLQAIATTTVTSSGLTGEGAVAPQADQLLTFFQTTQGRTVLSRSGEPLRVAIDDAFVETGTVFLYVIDESPPSFAGAQRSYWRAYFDAGTSVVALSVIGMGDDEIARLDGLTVLRDFVELNARAPLIAEVAPETPAPGAAPTGTTPGLLDRLFR